jgi:hypothetical protein
MRFVRLEIDSVTWAEFVTIRTDNQGHTTREHNANLAAGMCVYAVLRVRNVIPFRYEPTFG